jgi:hypothetical protein
MKKLLIFVSIALVFAACQDKNPKRVQKVIHCYAETDIPYVTYIYEVVGTDSTWIAEKWYHENGNVMLEGKVVDNQREGEYLGYYPTGELMSVGNFVHGKREGKGKIYFESGKVSTNNEYCDGKPCGVWEFFDEDGNLIGIREY